jgi:hypothetical protein
MALLYSSDDWSRIAELHMYVVKPHKLMPINSERFRPGRVRVEFRDPIDSACLVEIILTMNNGQKNREKKEQNNLYY